VQFLTVDPLVDQTEQPYGYVAGDPVDGLDLDGLDGGYLSLDGFADGLSVNDSSPFALDDLMSLAPQTSTPYTLGNASAGTADDSLHPTLVGIAAVIFLAIETCKQTGACSGSSTAVIEKRLWDLVHQAVIRGGSGRVISHTVKHKNRKAARDAAAADSAKGKAPVHDPAQDGNPPHYHPVGPGGNRRIPNVHHDYPG
jgi:hypothetical protein